MSCNQHCKDLRYRKGKELDSPKRCRCEKYEEDCKSNAVSEWITEGILTCGYDVCSLGKYNINEKFIQYYYSCHFIASYREEAGKLTQCIYFKLK